MTLLPVESATRVSPQVRSTPQQSSESKRKCVPVACVLRYLITFCAGQISPARRGPARPGLCFTNSPCAYHRTTTILNEYFFGSRPEPVKSPINILLTGFLEICPNLSVDNQQVKCFKFKEYGNIKAFCLSFFKKVATLLLLYFARFHGPRACAKNYYQCKETDQLSDKNY